MNDNQFAPDILNFFTGVGSHGTGPVINADDFTPKDNTRAYIMTPRLFHDNTNIFDANPQASQYAAKIDTLRTTLRTVLGQNLPIALWNYIPLDCRESVAPELGTDERGEALFQFDPNSDGRGTPGWRLFYERLLFQNTDPVPGAAAALGVPPPP